jgi:hypothetical protein
MKDIPLFNFPAFELYARIWRKHGWTIISPHEIDIVLGYPQPGPGPAWEDALGWDEKIIPTCDALFLLPGWQGSEGVKRELRVAFAHNLTIFDAVTGTAIQREATEYALRDADNITAIRPDPRAGTCFGGSPKSTYETFTPSQSLVEFVQRQSEEARRQVYEAEVMDEHPSHVDTGIIRQFATGATRDTATDKPDYEAFLSPVVIERYGRYMMEHQVQPDGTLRPGDNWQKGIPIDVYMKSMWRHFLAVWSAHRDQGYANEADLCALKFNVDGMLHEILEGHR